MALNFQTHHMPLAAGQNAKADPRALEAPALAVCRNAEFDEVGGLQTRKPYAAITSHASNTIGDIRRLAVYDGELVAFTKDGLWSYSETDGRWAERATYLAPKLTERTRFVTPNEQTGCDRAELDGVVMFCWAENVAVQEKFFVAAIDAETGAVLLPPTEYAGVVPRLLALQNRIHLYYHTGVAHWTVVEYDPADLSATEATAIAESPSVPYHDVCRNADGDGALWFVSTDDFTNAVRLFAVSTGPSASALGSALSRSGPLAVASIPDGGAATIGGNSGNLVLDRWGSTLASSTLVTVAAPSGTVVHATAATRPDPGGGGYTIDVFWTEDETASQSDFSLFHNTVTGTTAGTATSLVHRLGLASRAFVYDGDVYVWGVFDGETAVSGLSSQLGLRAQLQSAYFLYRSDGELVARAGGNRAAGLVTTKGHLPNVQDLGSNRFAWCGGERRIIELGGNHGGFGAKAPREIVLEFDSDEARRCVQLGGTLYIPGAEMRQYDGQNLHELGFHVYPWYFATLELTSGTIAAGTYTYGSTYRHENAKGELDRSTTATYGAMVASIDDVRVQFEQIPLHVTHRTASPPAVELWRSKVDPPLDAPLLLTNSLDPTDDSGANQYLANAYDDDFQETYIDDLDDDALATKQAYPQNGGVLPNLVPPAATIIAATQDRLFLAGISDAPHRIAYSKYRGDGEVAAFNDGLVVDLPPEGGPITALAFHNETLVAFKEHAVYAIPGEGFGNLGGIDQSQNYGPARLISSDVGARNAESVALTPRGLLFLSEKGWYLLGGGWGVEYVGAPVCDFDDDDFVAVHVMESQHKVRCMSTSRVLTWDYLVDQWSEETVSDGLHAVIWDGVYTYAASDGETVKQEQDDWAGNAEAFGLDVETAWIDLAGMQGMQKVRRIMVLGEYRGAHRLQLRIAYDYQVDGAGDPLWVDDKVWTPSPTTVGGPLQVRHGCKQKRCQSVKVRITALDSALDQAPVTEALALTGLAFEIGVKPGLYQRLPAAQKQ